MPAPSLELAVDIRAIGQISTSSWMVSDDELAAEALAADPNPVLDNDAVPFGRPEPTASLLPDWYMPAPTGLRRRRGRLVLAIFVLALLAGNAVGLCVTYGVPEIAW